MPIISFLGSPVDKKNKFANPPARFPIIVEKPVARPIGPAKIQLFGRAVFADLSLHNMITTLKNMMSAIQNLNSVSFKLFPTYTAVRIPIITAGKYLNR